MKIIWVLISLIISLASFGQSPGITGNITDFNSNQPIEGVTINLLPENQTSSTDIAGNFSFRSFKNVTGIQISAIGYKSKTLSLNEFEQNKNTISLKS